jgi:hypothetical protein
MITDSPSRSVIADMQVIVTLQADDTVPDAADDMSRARHLALTVADPACQPVL